jgi:hypothetical protein
MKMRIDQARHHGAPSKVDHLCIGTSLLEGGGIITDHHEAFPSNGDCLCCAEVPIDCRDLAVVQDEIRGLSPSRLPKARVPRRAATTVPQAPLVVIVVSPGQVVRVSADLERLHLNICEADD